MASVSGFSPSKLQVTLLQLPVAGVEQGGSGGGNATDIGSSSAASASGMNSGSTASASGVNDAGGAAASATALATRRRVLLQAPELSAGIITNIGNGSDGNGSVSGEGLLIRARSEQVRATCCALAACIRCPALLCCLSCVTSSCLLYPSHVRHSTVRSIFSAIMPQGVTCSHTLTPMNLTLCSSSLLHLRLLPSAPLIAPLPRA